ncbi:MAG: hypothetical protein U5L74_04230 [Ideonella sp.]|nr:hypothetical protein [Ideonella sp.]
MRHADLKAVAHNIADSLASGMGFMIGVYQTNIFGEAAAQAPGYIEVDFLRGTLAGSPFSASLSSGVALYCQEALPELCEKHGVNLAEVRTLKARFSAHPVYGPQFVVTVEDRLGKRSEEHYAGYLGRRLRTRR